MPPSHGHMSAVLEMGTLTQDRGAVSPHTSTFSSFQKLPEAEEPPGRCLGGR